MSNTDTISQRPNILLITVDDMNWDAVGAYGCPVKDTTPNIDALAAGGMRFNHGHVTIAVCQPSRSVMMTGLYPHHCGGEGFFTLRKTGVPILPAILRAEGYRVGILGKVGHSTPYADFEWDMTYDMDDLGHGRNPALYGRYATEFMTARNQEKQPFFLMFNSHDPHRPFYGNDNPDWYREHAHPQAAVPSRTFSPEEVTTPGFLPDLPQVRVEIAEYYNSVRRCDDSIGAALRALDTAGCADNTLVILLSDNGMAFPFSKTNCYLHSTKTPFIVRWPSVIPANQYDNSHFVSGIDLMPTILDAVDAKQRPSMDGHSFLPVLKNSPQTDRGCVFTQFHQTAGFRNYPMRCVQDHRFGYIFNPWSDGKRVFHNESQQGRTFAAMEQAAVKDNALAQRLEVFLHRTVEELYDFHKDPDALHNLANDPAHATDLKRMQDTLEQWMVHTADPALDAFKLRHDPEALARFMVETSQDIGGN